ncbi:MAG: hypothetical protein OSJ22_04655 [Rikenellaceae bacterium]|nr:hypothetical protein [Rikenellaceae bacterium]
MDLSIAAAMFAIAAAGLSHYYSSTRARRIDKFDIKIEGGDTLGFVTVDKVRTLVDDSLGWVTTVGGTDVRRIEKYIDSMIYVLDSEVYKDESGTLHMEIAPRIPRVRVMTYGGESFYMDDYGVIIPRCADFVADVPLVTMSDSALSEYMPHVAGNKIISKNYNFTDNLINFAVKVESDPFWSDFIAQINLNEAGEIEIIPRIGSHKVILCEVSDLGSADIFLGKLYKLYFGQLKQTGWNRYSLINLKYNKMAVCTK